MILNIQPVTGFGKTANKIEIYTLPYLLDGSGVTLYYQLLQNTERVLDGNVSLTAEEISTWGLDDNVVIDLALSKIDVTKIDE